MFIHSHTIPLFLISRVKCRFSNVLPSSKPCFSASFPSSIIIQLHQNFLFPNLPCALIFKYLLLLLLLLLSFCLCPSCFLCFDFLFHFPQNRIASKPLYLLFPRPGVIFSSCLAWEAPSPFEIPDEMPYSWRDFPDHPLQRKLSPSQCISHIPASYLYTLDYSLLSVHLFIYLFMLPQLDCLKKGLCHISHCSSVL